MTATARQDFLAKGRLFAPSMPEALQRIAECTHHPRDSNRFVSFHKGAHCMRRRGRILGRMHHFSAGQPPDRLAGQPRLISSATTTSGWSPWISITLLRTVPPEPQRFLSWVASASKSPCASGRPVTVVTALPARPWTSRPTRTAFRVCGAGRLFGQTHLPDRTAAIGTESPRARRINDPVGHGLLCRLHRQGRMAA